jgi:hypothetical protein
MSEPSTNPYYAAAEPEFKVTPAELEWLRIALDGAGKAVPVLFTMLSKAGMKEGAMVADEINANIITANRELQRILRRVSREDSRS